MAQTKSQKVAAAKKAQEERAAAAKLKEEERAAAAKLKEEGAAASKRKRSDDEAESEKAASGEKEAASETPTTETGEPVEKKRRGMTSAVITMKPAADGNKDDRKVTGTALAEALEAVGKHTFSVGFGPGKERR